MLIAAVVQLPPAGTAATLLAEPRLAATGAACAPNGKWLLTADPASRRRFQLHALPSGQCALPCCSVLALLLFHHSLLTHSSRRIVATLQLDVRHVKAGIAWAPNAQCLALTFRAYTDPPELGVHIFSSVGGAIECVSSLPSSAASGLQRSLDLQPRCFQWSPDSRHVAAWVGDALVILSASDCSIAASLPALSLLGGSALPAGCSYLHCSWLPGPGASRLVAYAEGAKHLRIYTLPGQQLRKESTPAFASSPVWSALGCAAYLTLSETCACCGGPADGTTSEVLIWQPWYSVPRPSGACSGGQVVRSGTHVQNGASLSWSPCGTMLAAGHARLEGAEGALKLMVDLLDWRTGRRLQLCNFRLPGPDLYEPSVCGPMAPPSGRLGFDVHTSWARSGKAIHLGVEISTEHGGTNTLCSFVTALPE